MSSRDTQVEAIEFVPFYDLIFSGAEFRALDSAHSFLRRAGFSSGPGCAGQPTALMFGDYRIAKWKNLTLQERRASHGVMTGDRRSGPLRLRLTIHCPAEGLEAFMCEASDLEGIC